MPAIPKKLPMLSHVGPAPTITTETDALTWSPSLVPCPGDRYPGWESIGSLLISSVSFIKGHINRLIIKDTFEGYFGATICNRVQCYLYLSMGGIGSRHLFWCGLYYHTQAIFWTQRDKRLWHDWKTWYKSWCVVLQDSSCDQAEFHLGQRSSDTDTRTATEGEVSPGWCTLSTLRLPTLWPEYFWIAPDIGQVVE